MAEVSPIKMLDDDEAIAWLKAQPGARTTLPPAELARRWGWPRQRAGRRLKTWAKAGLITRRGRAVTVANGTPQKSPRRRVTNQSQRIDDAQELHGSVTPLVTPSVPIPSEAFVPLPNSALVTRHVTAIDVLAYTAAVTLAGTAAFFSIKGMVVLFPGAPMAVVAMTLAMESTKLVAAAWLARRWRATAWIWRFALIAFIAGLALINAAGVYAQLVAAHVADRGAAQSAIQTQDAAIAARIEVQSHTVADLDRRLAQIDTAIEEAAKRGRMNTALSAIEGQRRARTALVDERNREAGTQAALKAERASVAAKGRQIETEAAPIRYVAELIGADTDSERAIRWLIALMVLCCDPLAIALTAAASARR
jgi:MarR family